ncbi:hypothetical protein [Escherichia coli]|uniref:hypothetical protein n=1 Tax=Escherichia coli TaxID=562 RepID=UPI001E494F63|nr:hypothetical protein [Escherichia coli]HEI3782369.1 hypothetical protein [Escherichia coli]
MNIRLLTICTLLSALGIGVFSGAAKAASSTDVRITSHVREPVCNVEVPPEVDLGLVMNTPSEKTRPHFTLKIDCQETVSVTTWLTAKAPVSGNEYATRISVTEEDLSLVLEDGKQISFNDTIAFCKGDVDRDCKITPVTKSTNYDISGEGQATVVISLHYN